MLWYLLFPSLHLWPHGVCPMLCWLKMRRLGVGALKLSIARGREWNQVTPADLLRSRVFFFFFSVSSNLLVGSLVLEEYTEFPYDKCWTVQSTWAFPFIIVRTWCSIPKAALTGPATYFLQCMQRREGRDNPSPAFQKSCLISLPSILGADSAFLKSLHQQNLKKSVNWVSQVPRAIKY